MKSAQWSKVASAIRRKYSLSWADAKSAYKTLREKEGRAPSLRMVKNLPETKPRYIKKTPPQKKTVELPKPRDRPVKQIPLGRNIEFAPPLPPAKWSGPAKVRKNQYARNGFEEILKEKGLPVKIARNASGKAISSLWKSPRKQRMVANRIKAAFQDIKRFGRVSLRSSDGLLELLEDLFEGEDIRGMYYQFMKQLYGKAPK